MPGSSPQPVRIRGLGNNRLSSFCPCTLFWSDFLPSTIYRHTMARNGSIRDFTKLDNVDMLALRLQSTSNVAHDFFCFLSQNGMLRILIPSDDTVSKNGELFNSHFNRDCHSAITFAINQAVPFWQYRKAFVTHNYSRFPPYLSEHVTSRVAGCPTQARLPDLSGTRR